jgi:hypothetical protein
MLLRVAAVLCACICTCMVGAVAALAEDLGPEQARAFVVGKLFAYTCFDGTAGMGRIFADGSVVGTIRPGGRGEARFAALPAGTLKVDGSAMCAHLTGLPIEPCFKVQKIDYHSFRGTVSGLGFAYCDFYQHNPRAELIARAPAPLRTAPVTPVRTAPITPVSAAPITPVQSTPIANLRPAIEE